MDKMRFNSPYVSTQKTKYLVTGTSLKWGVINSELLIYNVCNFNLDLTLLFGLNTDCVIMWNEMNALKIKYKLQKE
jgi:hypothetical protein